MTRPLNVLISGGGIAGLTLAYWLRQGGHRPIIVEKAPSLRQEGYMIDFFGLGYTVAEKMGLVPELEAIHYSIPWDFVNRLGKVKISLKYATLRRLMGGRHFNLMRGDLERILYGKIEADVPVRFGSSISSIEQDASQDALHGHGQRQSKAHVRFADGTGDTYDLVVGADGIHSHIRALAFGDEAAFTRFLGYDAVAYIVDRETIEHDNALMRLREAFYTLTVPKRQVAIYPIRGGRAATFFVYQVPRVPLDRTSPAATHELDATYGDLDWVVPQLLQSAQRAEDIYFDAVSQIEMPAWSVGHVTLVGDACGAVSLMAGQGASLAMAGSYVLAREISAHDDIEAALAEYEREMKPIVVKKQVAGRAFAHWFLPETPTRVWLRDLSLRMAHWRLFAPLIRQEFAFDSRLTL